MSGASKQSTYAAQRLLLFDPARYDGEVDRISSTTTWCLWWRESAGRVLPTCAKVRRERRATGAMATRVWSGEAGYAMLMT
jgi:hypothetical protein